MTTRTKSNLGTVTGWGIATKSNGVLELVATANGRLEIRALKREAFPGKDYKVVKIEAKLTHYTK